MYSETNKDNVVKKFFRRNKKNRLHKRYLKNVLNVEKPDVVIPLVETNYSFFRILKMVVKKWPKFIFQDGLGFNLIGMEFGN